MTEILGTTRLPTFEEMRAAKQGTSPEWDWYFIASGAMPPSMTDIFATTEYVVRPSLGGEGVDVLDAVWTNDIHAGFQSARLSVLPPRGVSTYADSVLDGVVLPDLNNHTLWEGRVEEPEITFSGDDERGLECTGYIAYLEDEGAFRRCYVDGSLLNWQFDQCTSYSEVFTVGIEDQGGDIRENDGAKAPDGRMVMRVSADLAGSIDTHVTLKEGFNCRMYWRLFQGQSGTDLTADVISGFKFRYESHGIRTGSPNLMCKLYARDKLSGGEVNRLLWTHPAVAANPPDDHGTVTLDANDIGNDVKVLVFKLVQEDDDLGYVGQADPELDDWDISNGVSITDPRVYASELGTNITPERVVEDMVEAIVDEDHRDFYDTSGQTIGHLYFEDFVSINEAVAQVNRLLDWNYGFGEGGVFYYEKPWTAATVPADQLIVTSMVDPKMSNWNVRMDYSECYNKVVAEYQATPKRTDTVVVKESDGPLGSHWRVKTLDLTGECDDETEATTVATRYLADHLWPKPTGSVDLTDTVHLACGLDIPAVQVKQGMMIYNMDIPSERGGGYLLITSIDGSLIDRRLTANVGVRSDRLDRWLARNELKARARARKKATK